jgi:hypothetical protein
MKKKNVGAKYSLTLPYYFRSVDYISRLICMKPLVLIIAFLSFTHISGAQTVS